MNFTQALKMAAKSISANKGRSALTMLGVIIGLASVIILVSYAKGQNLAMQEYYKSMGDNKLSIYAYTWQGGLDVSTELYNYCLQLLTNMWTALPPWDKSTMIPPSNTVSRLWGKQF